jgi:glyceraldehyde 3-phosphate dehydrogenase
MKRIAINGFGRIGKMALRVIFERHSDLEVVAINDLAGTAVASHLFEFDSTYGRFPGEVSYNEKEIIINGKHIHICADRDAEKLPWKELDIDIVLECTGVFRTKELASKHLKAGAKKVLISAPAKDAVDATVVFGVNEHTVDKKNHTIISNASCTTNCLAPVVKVLHEEFGMKHGLMNTIHAYTADQRLLDSSHKDCRRARSACESIIPTKTGAAQAISLVIPELSGKLDGFAMRVPTPTVSTVDLSFETEKPVTVESINALFQKVSQTSMKNIIGYEERPLVSIDYRKDDRSAIFDGTLTRTMGNHFAKIVAWYDNEWGYANRLIDLTEYIAHIK